jgi:hypothetical protein
MGITVKKIIGTAVGTIMAVGLSAGAAVASDSAALKPVHLASAYALTFSYEGGGPYAGVLEHVRVTAKGKVTGVMLDAPGFGDPAPVTGTLHGITVVLTVGSAGNVLRGTVSRRTGDISGSYKGPIIGDPGGVWKAVPERSS